MDLLGARACVSVQRQGQPFNCPGEARYLWHT